MSALTKLIVGGGAMQHSGGIYREASWTGVWPPPSSFLHSSPSESALLPGCTVVKIYNLSFKKAGGGQQTGYLSGKKTADQVYKCVGVVVRLPAEVGQAFSTFIAPFFKTYYSTEDPSAVVEHASAGDGRTFTMWADADQLARVVGSSSGTAAASNNSAASAGGALVGDALKEGDQVTLRTRGNSLFVKEIVCEVSSSKDKSLAGMHQVTSMYLSKAVNVDEGLVENIAKAQQHTALLAKKAEEAAKASSGKPKDVEDSEWD